MGILQFFGIGLTPEQRIERLLKKAKNVYAQPEYRRDAMDALLKLATPEAYLALCKRFTVVCQSAHWDEEEKRWLVDTFAELGQQVVGPLQDFVRKDDSLNYPMRALDRILPPAAMEAFLVEALQGRTPDDHRSDRGKLELIDTIGHRPMAPHLVSAILPYLHDHSDDVRCKTVEVLEGWGERGHAAELFGLVIDETSSARVQRRAADAVCALGLAAVQSLDNLPGAVREDFEVDGLTLRRKRPRPETTA